VKYTFRRSGNRIAAGSWPLLATPPDMRLQRRRLHRYCWVGIVFCAGVAGGCGGAAAFDFFGLFGSEEAPPPVSRDALPYTVEFDTPGADEALETRLKDASNLYRLRQDAPPDGDSLARRAQSDFAPLIDTLWGAGFYDATVEIGIGTARLRIGEDSIAALSRAAQAHRDKSVVPIKIFVQPGPLFTLGTVLVRDARTGEAFDPQQLPQRIIGLMAGDPARASDITAAQARMIDYFRTRSHPLAKVAAVRPVVDHAAHRMDLTIVLDPGPRAGFGEVTIAGPQQFPSAVVRSFIYVEPGDPYSPKVLADTRESLRQIQALGSVRIREATTLNADGNLPISVEADDRLPYVVGFAAKYSSIDGPLGQAYWEDRNLFGGAERLRLEGDLFVNQPINGTRIASFRDLTLGNLGGRFKASFIKPALDGTVNDLLIDGVVENAGTGGDRFGGYKSKLADLNAAIRHRFDDKFSMQIGADGMIGQATDSLGKVDYRLIGIPIGLTYDSTDSKLDPTRGFRIHASFAPYPEFLGSSLNLMQFKAQASTYYAIDEEARYILAGRIGFGSLTGSSLADIPANMRFYAGGGGSVRGYRYLSLGPRGPYGFVIGGRSLFEASAELRIKITETIGIAPFFDAGNAFTSSLPSFKDVLQMSAGLGLRYYTAIGPIRLDVAAPLNPRPGDKPIAIYVSIGQAF
jgi:translocation and assembly module TamA